MAKETQTLKYIMIKKSAYLTFVFILLLTGQLHALKSDLNRDLQSAEHAYYNNQMGYIIINADTVLMYSPVEEDSTKYHLCAQCLSSYCDSTHIRIASLNSLMSFLDELIEVDTLCSNVPDIGRNITIRILGDDAGKEFSIVFSTYDNDSNFFNSVCTTTKEKYTVINLKEANENDYEKITRLMCSIEPTTNKYTPSNKQQLYYGLIDLLSPPIYIGNSKSVSITVSDFSEFYFSQYYIPESYMTLSNDKTSLFWRGYTYTKIK